MTDQPSGNDSTDTEAEDASHVPGSDEANGQGDEEIIRSEYDGDNSAPAGHDEAEDVAASSAEKVKAAEENLAAEGFSDDEDEEEDDRPPIQEPGAADAQKTRSTFNRIVEGKPGTGLVEFEAYGEQMSFSMSGLNREKRYEYMSQLPPAMFAAGMAGSPVEALAAGASVVPDGPGAMAMEDLLVESLSHPLFGETDIRLLVKNLRDPVMFDACVTVLKFSIQQGDVTGFRHNQ